MQVFLVGLRGFYEAYFIGRGVAGFGDVGERVCSGEEGFWSGGGKRGVRVQGGEGGEDYAGGGGGGLQLEKSDLG